MLPSRLQSIALAILLTSTALATTTIEPASAEHASRTFTLQDPPIPGNTLQIPVLGGITIDVTPYAAVTDDYRVLNWGFLDRTLASPGTLTTYEGVVRRDPDAVARVLVGPSGVFAYILKGDALIAVHPASFDDTDAPKGLHVVDVYRGGTAFAAPVDNGGVTFVPDPVPEQPQYSLPATSIREARIFLVGDDAFTRYHRAYYGVGATDRAQEVATSFTLLLDAIYSKQVGVRVRLAGLDLWSIPDPFYSITLGDSLNRFREYYELGGGRITSPARDVSHLLTGLDYPGTEVGRAYVASLATSYAYGVSESVLPSARSAVLIAHEVGHNFGGVHESAELSPPTILAPNVCTCGEFSDGMPFAHLDNLAKLQTLARDRLRATIL